MLSHGFRFLGIHFFTIDTENIKLVFCAVKDTIMQTALKEFNLAWGYIIVETFRETCFNAETHGLIKIVL